jgi:hypothetical protein
MLRIRGKTGNNSIMRFRRIGSPRGGGCTRRAETAIGRPILYTGSGRPARRLKEFFMAETVVRLRLNQQQLELMDRTIARGVAPDRVSLVRLALREYAAARKAEAAAR